MYHTRFLMLDIQGETDQWQIQNSKGTVSKSGPLLRELRELLKAK